MIQKKVNILKLYADEFDNLYVWESICEVLSISPSNEKVSIEFTNIKTEEI